MNALRFSRLFKKKDLGLAAKPPSKHKFGLWRPKGKLLELSGELCLREDLTVYDSCYAALAQRTGTKLLLETDRPVLQPQSGSSAFSALGGAERIPNSTSQADLEKEPSLLCDLFLGGIGYWQD